MDPEYLPRMAKAFGLGAPTGIPYLPEAAGALPDPAWKLETFGDYWATGDAINLAIGQGFLQATPLQLATPTPRSPMAVISFSRTSSPSWSIRAG
jgi:penicillin-binding protein 2